MGERRWLRSSSNEVGCYKRLLRPSIHILGNTNNIILFPSTDECPTYPIGSRRGANQQQQQQRQMRGAQTESITHTAQPSYSYLFFFFFKYRTYIYWRGCALCVRWIFSYTFMANARTRCREIDKKKKNGPSLCEWMCVCLFGCKVSSFSLPPSHFHHKCFGSHLFSAFFMRLCVVVSFWRRSLIYSRVEVPAKEYEGEHRLFPSLETSGEKKNQK